MFKKTILWGFYVLFVGSLIWAAANRSSLKLVENQNTSGNLGSKTAAISTIDSEEHQNEAGAREQTLVILSGTLTTIGKRDASITLEGGTLLTLNPRSWRFAVEQGLQAQVGDDLLVTAFDENGKIEIAHLRNLANGSVAQLRDEDAHPLWNSNNAD